MMNILLIIGLLGSFLVDQTPADKVSEIHYSWEKEPIKVRDIFYDHEGKQQRVVYKSYVPKSKDDQLMPVFVCAGGLPIDEDKYVHSDPRDCFDKKFLEFADENEIVILGVGFLFVKDNWANKSSYQYAKVWSGKALIKILDELKKELPINTEELYLYGISAGAQFSVRFAQRWPQKVKAVAAHAGGGYDWPSEYIPVKFLMTVGEEDNDPITRVEFAQYFTGIAHKLGIDIRLKIIPGIGHRQTEEQNQMTRDFFKVILNQE